jgi:hypothetical protein
VGITHVCVSPTALQHPGQDVPAQVQAPFVHPPEHMPHAPPPRPHSVFDWASTKTQVPSELQQPLAHELAVQAHFPVLLSQVSPVGHPRQLRPPTPH